MGLLGRRWLSFSISHSRQALFTPYVEPMNKEQERKLRKDLLRKEPTYHPRIPTDITRILQLNSPSEDKLKKRAATVAWLNDIILSTFGKQFSVQDTSLSQYALDLEYAPLEVTIVDHSRSDGIPPGSEDESRKGPYDPMNLVKILQEHGLTGTIIDGDAFHLNTDPAYNEDLANMEELDPHPAYFSWSNPKFFPVPYIRYPAVINAEETKNLLSFHLSPPMPTLKPLISLLQTYFQSAVYKQLVTFVYYWVRTIGLERLSPTCVALMVIVFLQAKKWLPVLQDPENRSVDELQKADTGVWVVADFPPRFLPQSFYVETGSFHMNTEHDVLKRQIKRSLFGFMEFWATHNPKSTVIASEQIFSVRTGIFAPRPSAGKRNSTARHEIKEHLAKIQRGIEPWSPLMPPATWLHQPIVIADPFIPSFNHARSLSPHACRFFHYAAAVSRRTLFHGHSVHNILGNALSKHRRYYSTSVFSQQIKDCYTALSPSPQVFDRRRLTIARIEKVIKKEFGSQFYLLNFGSTRYGVSVADSDLDLVIIDPAYPVGIAPQHKLSKLSSIYSVRNVGNALAAYRFAQVHIIPTASVPIVKCRDPTTGIDCDININDRLGLINTILIENYCKIAPNIRPMCVAVKRWAKYCNLNDSSGISGPRTFSSYTLVLTVIGYLQMKGILPNLQDDLSPLPPNPRRGIFYIRHKKKAVLCDTRFREVDRHVSPVDFDLGEALLGWFNFWGNEFNYMTHFLSVREGGLIKRPLIDQMGLDKSRKKKEKEAKKEKAKQKEEVEVEVEVEIAAGATGNQPEPENDKELILRKIEFDGEEKEDDAVAAWNEQEGEEEEGELEDNEDGSEGLPSELDELDLEDINEPATVDVPETVALPSPPKSPRPKVKSWKTAFVIADPFNQDKNLTSHFGLPRLNQFQAECRAATELIKSGGTLEDLIPTYTPDSDYDNESSNSEERTKKKKKKSRLGIPIKPPRTLKDIGSIDPTRRPLQTQKTHRKPYNNKGKSKDNHTDSQPMSPGTNENSLHSPQEPVAGPSTGTL